MKIRKGFVSNSSSSSFIVIDASKGHINPYFPSSLIVDHNFGNTEFGWEPDKFYDIGSRIVFTYLQAKWYAKNDEWVRMLEEVIKENTDVKEIEWKLSHEWNDDAWAYIDHQSAASEGQNIEMFDSKETLKDFIFGSGSYIVTDNDNH
jgi:hypothetical protein